MDRNPTDSVLSQTDSPHDSASTDHSRQDGGDDGNHSSKQILAGSPNPEAETDKTATTRVAPEEADAETDAGKKDIWDIGALIEKYPAVLIVLSILVVVLGSGGAITIRSVRLGLPEQSPAVIKAIVLVLGITAFFIGASEVCSRHFSGIDRGINRVVLAVAWLGLSIFAGIFAFATPPQTQNPFSSLRYFFGADKVIADVRYSLLRGELKGRKVCLAVRKNNDDPSDANTSVFYSPPRDFAPDRDNADNVRLELDAKALKVLPPDYVYVFLVSLPQTWKDEDPNAKAKTLNDLYALGGISSRSGVCEIDWQARAPGEGARIEAQIRLAAKVAYPTTGPSHLLGDSIGPN